MKKIEMEFHNAQYAEQLRESYDAQSQGMYRRAVDTALAAWKHIEGMLRFAQKYEDEDVRSVAAVDIVLKLCPLLLDSAGLRAVEDLLSESKRVERDTTSDVGASLSAAWKRLWDCHRLWAFLESEPQTRQDRLSKVLGGDQDQWRATAESWERMGLLSRIPRGGSYTLSLTTRLGQIIRAKCPNCGEISEMPKAMALEQMNCGGCSIGVSHVLLTSETGDQTTN